MKSTRTGKLQYYLLSIAGRYFAKTRTYRWYTDDVMYAEWFRSETDAMDAVKSLTPLFGFAPEKTGISVNLIDLAVEYKFHYAVESRVMGN